MSAFIFKKYYYDPIEKEASFIYSYGDGRDFCEKIRFEQALDIYDEQALDRALFLAFLVTGTSYYKTFPVRDIVFETGAIDAWQSEFCRQVYQEGLSQFAYENDLGRNDLAQFLATTSASYKEPVAYQGHGIIALQSGGKDSLLVAHQLETKGLSYTPWYVSQGVSYPHILDDLKESVVVAHRNIDRPALARASQEGGRNGHVPVTYILSSYALIQAILLQKDTVLVAIGHEGAEPHAWIDDLAITHQWSKTWPAEQLLAEYIARYVSPDIRIGSPLRAFSELKIAEVFANNAWSRFGSQFSSCNVANYQQGVDNKQLIWCGQCPKCVNSYLLFAPFIDKQTLDSLMGGDVFAKRELDDTIKGLLGVDGVMKPFECVGEVAELSLAYHLARENGYTELPFDVPQSDFNKDSLYDAQAWVRELLQ